MISVCCVWTNIWGNFGPPSISGGLRLLLEKLLPCEDRRAVSPDQPLKRPQGLWLNSDKKQGLGVVRWVETVFFLKPWEFSGWAKPWEESHGKVKSGFVDSQPCCWEVSTFLDEGWMNEKERAMFWMEIVVLENPSLVMGFLLEILWRLFQHLKNGSLNQNHVQ